MTTVDHMNILKTSPYPKVTCFMNSPLITQFHTFKKSKTYPVSLSAQKDCRAINRSV